MIARRQNEPPHDPWFMPGFWDDVKFGDRSHCWNLYILGARGVSMVNSSAKSRKAI